jgi:PAS domain S-box-containing protein
MKISHFVKSSATTAPQQAEQVLRANELRLKEVQRIAKMGSWELDLVSGELLWSDEVFLIFEIDQTLLDVSYKVCLSRVHPEDRDAVNQAWDNSLTTYSPYEITYRLFLPDGRIKWVNTHWDTFHDDQGKAFRATGTVQDITERKEVEAKSATYLDAIGNLALVSIADRRGHILQANAMFCEVSGYSEEELIGRDHRILNSGTHPKAFFVEMWATIVRGDTWHKEIFNRSKSGTLYWVDSTIVPLKDSSGQVTSYLSFRVDITKRKLIEIEVTKAKTDAEKANLAKSHFISHMSHELRTPLNVMLGYAQLMESGSIPPTPRQMTMLKEIIGGGWYLLELINKILDLAAIESGKLVVAREPVCMTEVVAECRTMIEPQAHERSIQLIFLLPDMHVFVEGDRTRVKQVLINLLSNAIKYNSEGGTVEVSCNTVAPGRIRISVRDTGPGLPPEKLAQLFEQFNRLGRETGSVEGTGIGLVVTKQLIELMGGKIGVESTVGKGSVFWFELVSVDL